MGDPLWSVPLKKRHIPPLNMLSVNTFALSIRIVATYRPNKKRCQIVRKTAMTPLTRIHTPIYQNSHPNIPEFTSQCTRIHTPYSIHAKIVYAKVINAYILILFIAYTHLAYLVKKSSLCIWNITAFCNLQPPHCVSKP